MKKLTVDDLFDLFHKSAQVTINNKWFIVICAYEDGVAFKDYEGNEYDYEYENIACMIEGGKWGVEFYELKKIEI